MSVALADVAASGVLGELHTMKASEPARGRRGVSGDVVALVLVQLAAHANGERVAWPSPATIAGHLNMSRTTVLEALGVLETLGHIQAVGTGKNRVRRWFIAAGYVPVDNSEVVPVVVPVVVPAVVPARVHEQGTRNKEGGARERGAPSHTTGQVSELRPTECPTHGLDDPGHGCRGCQHARENREILAEAQAAEQRAQARGPLCDHGVRIHLLNQTLTHCPTCHTEGHIVLTVTDAS